MTRWLILAVLAVAATAAHGQAIVVATCGSGAYPVGQLHQLTMNPAGYLCVSTTTMAATEAAPATSGAVHPPEAPKPPTPLLEPKK
jgi:hypothetical protein